MLDVGTGSEKCMVSCDGARWLHIVCLKLGFAMSIKFHQLAQDPDGVILKLSHHSEPTISYMSLRSILRTALVFTKLLYKTYVVVLFVDKHYYDARRAHSIICQLPP